MFLKFNMHYYISFFRKLLPELENQLVRVMLYSVIITLGENIIFKNISLIRKRKYSERKAFFHFVIILMNRCIIALGNI